MNEVFALMTLQALLGALDGRWHRAVGPRAPLRRPAARGFALHAARALLNVVLFLALAWFEWRGAWVVPIALSLLAAAGVVLADLIAGSRALVEDTLFRVREIELKLGEGPEVERLVEPADTTRSHARSS